MLLENHSGYKLECGVDEVGRGCVAGPVVSAAVILPEGFNHPKLKDSKKMTQKAKDEVYDHIISNCISYGIGMATVEEIDSENILQATMIAMHRAISKLDINPEFILVDGNYFRPYESISHETVVKGDNKYMSIAAASVLAKVYRDRLMVDLANEYPYYDWENNAGYLTKKHKEGLKLEGLSPHHRKSFNIKF